MLGENIKNIRQKKGYTQEEIASRLHVTRQTISKWEKNYSVPDADLLVRLAEIFEIPTSELLNETKEEQEAELTKDQYAEQLAHIAEQMAIKNRRSSRIWKTIGYTLVIIVAAWLLLVILGSTFYSFGKNSITQNYEVSSESILVEEGIE